MAKKIVPVLAICLLLGVGPAPDLGAEDQKVLVVQISDLGCFAQVREYGFSSPIMEPNLLSKPKVVEGSSGNLAALVGELRRKEEIRSQAAVPLQGKLHREVETGFQQPGWRTCKVQQKPKWASSSPDGTFLLVGFNFLHEPIDSATLVRSSDFQTMAEIKGATAMVTISDFCWLPDSSALVILESTERWSKSPLGMLGARLGHPIPLDSFSIRIIDTQSLHERRIPIVTDLDYGLGVFTGGACVE